MNVSEYEIKDIIKRLEKVRIFPKITSTNYFRQSEKNTNSFMATKCAVKVSSQRRLRSLWR
jgi:hypothetical protein